MSVRVSSVTPLSLSVVVVVEKDTIGFHVYAPALKGLHAAGDTELEALKYAEEAIRVYLFCLISNNEPLPLGPQLSVSRDLDRPRIPRGALLQDLTIQWPSQEMSVTS